MKQDHQDKEKKKEDQDLGKADRDLRVEDQDLKREKEEDRDPLHAILGNTMDTKHLIKVEIDQDPLR